MGDYLTLVEAAERLEISPRMLRDRLAKRPMDAAGRPYFCPIGRSLLFNEDDIARLKCDLGDSCRAGFIYVVGHTDYLKIGFSTKIKKRLSSIQTSIPVPLVIHLIFPGTEADERRWHARFAAFRISGEWFKSDPSILDAMKGPAQLITSFCQGIAEQRQLGIERAKARLAADLKRPEAT